ncbi:pseudouridine synthase [Xylariomycetidae sp. FL0641]|nr:pseudouridine synthase [Xylariomycetidae sp. FL0641]
MSEKTDYGGWSREELLARIHALEAEVDKKHEGDATTSAVKPTGKEEGEASHKPEPGSSSSSSSTAAASQPGPPQDEPSEPEPPKKEKGKKKQKKAGIDPSKYATRLIALKIAYLGKAYGGYEYASSATVPTIEEALWRAMVRACLIFPDAGDDPDAVRWDDPRWEYSKCGRTDRGVSAFGQVIAVRVRSLRPLPKKEVEEEEEGGGMEKEEKREFDDDVDEIQYPRVLNKLLPPDIRVLAWCAAPPAGFSARHDCRERQYRYFFTLPAFSPVPDRLEPPTSNTTGVKTGWLDIAAMRDAAKRFEGLHDFRNFCKVDKTKPLASWARRIFEADVVEAPDAASALPYLDDAALRPAGPQQAGERYPKVYYFHVRGSAFLWHQIRCMVAVLFMVGQGLEPPAVVDHLLDVENCPRRPNYVLANETPLVLWDCVFPAKPPPSTTDDDAAPPYPSPSAAPPLLTWTYAGASPASSQHGPTGLVDQAWTAWRARKMDEVLAGQLLGLLVASPGTPTNSSSPPSAPSSRKNAASQRVFEGGDRDRLLGRWVPLRRLPTTTAPAEVYEREARRRGFASADAWRAEGARKRAAAQAAYAEKEAAAAVAGEDDEEEDLGD